MLLVAYGCFLTQVALNGFEKESVCIKTRWFCVGLVRWTWSPTLHLTCWQACVMKMRSFMCERSTKAFKGCNLSTCVLVANRYPIWEFRFSLPARTIDLTISDFRSQLSAYVLGVRRLRWRFFGSLRRSERPMRWSMRRTCERRSNMVAQAAGRRNAKVR